MRRRCGAKKSKPVIFYLRSETVSGTLRMRWPHIAIGAGTSPAKRLLFIRKLIQDHPELSRWKLSRELCEAWQWKQANGALRDMVCRGLLLMLHRAGEIELPPVKRMVRNRIAERQKPEPVIPDNRPVRGPLQSITPLEFVQVRRTPEEALFNSLMEQYHYLGYEQPIGEHLKYLVKANGQVIACLAWQSAPRHLKVRDRFLEWSEEARERNVHLLAYNTRFLILPWVRVEHLASHILGRMAKLVPQDWQRLYAHPIYWLETFVDTSRFRGTCYRAANWQVIGTTPGRGHRAPTFRANAAGEADVGLATSSQVPGVALRMKRKRVDVNLEELDQIMDHAREAPLSESESEKLKQALHALAGMLAQPRTTEKTSTVFGQPTDRAEAAEPIQKNAKGHGRNGASSYTGAKKVAVPHPTLHSGDPCPGCEKGKVYPQKEPRTLVRIVGQAPLAATVYELDRLRCNLCGEVFTAPEPEGVGPEKYDETTAAMIALLKYGSGMPFYRLEKLEHLLGIPLPASTQWEIVEEAAEVIKAARDELIRQAAQGEVLHNDDTAMRVLRLAREPSDERTGVFTSGIVSTKQGQKIALYFTGRQHAGENLRDVLAAPRNGAWPRLFRCVMHCRATHPN